MLSDIGPAQIPGNSVNKSMCNGFIFSKLIMPPTLLKSSRDTPLTPLGLPFVASEHLW